MPPSSGVAERRRTSLARAFRELDASRAGRLPRDVVTGLYLELRHYRELLEPAALDTALFFAALDRSGDGWVDAEEFTRLCELLQVGFQRAPRRTWFESLAPSLAASAGWRRTRELLLSSSFEGGIDALLLMTGAALVLEGEQFLYSGAPEDFDSRPNSLWNVLELVFAAAFALEMALKLAALGWSKYMGSLKNTFDALVTVATCVVAIIVYVPNAFNDSRLIRLVLLTRLLRLLRLLHWSVHVRSVSVTFLYAWPQAVKLGKMLFCMHYAFGALGVFCFGGLINTDSQRTEFEQLQASSFGKANYYPNNFNDLASGFVTCFELLIVNNWFVLCDGIVAASGTKWSRAFFVAFYATSVLSAHHGAKLLATECH